MYRRFPAACGLLSAGLLLSASAAATNGYFTHGTGIRSQGMAGVAQALPQDSLAAATNPAATALVGDQLDVGLTWFQPDRDARIQGSGAGADGHYDGNGDEQFLLPDLGYSRTLSPRLSWGIAIHGNGGMNTSYEQNPFAAFGSTGDAGVDFAQLFVTPSLAFQPMERHAFGIAVTYALQRFEGEGLDAFDNPFFSAEPGSVTDNGHDNAHGWGLSLGWIGQVHERLTLGLSWSSRIDTGEFDDYAGLFADQGGFDVPEHYGAGFSWQATDDLTLAGDWQRIQYSETNSVGNELAPLLAGIPLGSDNGPGFGWDDVDVFKLGAQYALGDRFTLRAGVSHADQPIPSDQTFFNILAPGVIEDHVSIGFTWQSRSIGEWSLAHTRALDNRVKGQGSIPAAFGGGEVDLSMNQDILGIGWSLSL